MWSGVWLVCRAPCYRDLKPSDDSEPLPGSKARAFFISGKSYRSPRYEISPETTDMEQLIK